MTLLVLAIFAANVASDRPVADSLLSPSRWPWASARIAAGRGEPDAVAWRTAHGRCGRHRAASRGDGKLGAMTVLATDKTGTLTAGVVRLDDATDTAGNPSGEVLRLAALNARLQTGLPNALDEAIITASATLALDDWTKSEEIPYDLSASA